MEPCNVIARASRRIGSWEPWCNVHDRNPMDCIAELEASLSFEKASGKALLESAKKAYNRAEKAEAEVERLRTDCNEWMRLKADSDRAYTILEHRFRPTEIHARNMEKAAQSWERRAKRLEKQLRGAEAMIRKLASRGVNPSGEPLGRKEGDDG